MKTSFKQLVCVCAIWGGVAQAQTKPSLKAARGIQLESQSSSSIPSGKAGIWNNAGTIKLRKTDGTDVNITTGAGASVSVTSPITGDGTLGSPLACSLCIIPATLAGAFNIATAQTVKLSLENSTAAGAGAQQYSPMLELIGRGWKTNATAASQTVKWGLQVRPVQGAASPGNELVFWDSVNGASYVDRFRMWDDGSINHFRSVRDALLLTNSALQGIYANADAVYLYSGDGRVFVDSDEMSPQTDDAISLGASAKRWSTVHAVSTETVGGSATLNTPGTHTGSNYRTQTADTETADATAATLWSEDLLGLPLATCWFDVKIIAAENSSGADQAAYFLRAAAQSAGGESGALIGAVDQYFVRESAGASGWNATIDVSGDTVRVRVTGAAATTIHWSGTIEQQCAYFTGP